MIEKKRMEAEPPTNGIDIDALNNEEAMTTDANATTKKKGEDQPTLDGWMCVTGEEALKAQYKGPCSKCSKDMQVSFRPYVGGKPPVCDTCYRANNTKFNYHGNNNNNRRNQRHQQQPQAPTLKGWIETTKRDEKTGRFIFKGPCGGCEKQTEVPFRPVNAPDAKPPLCDTCYASLQEVTNPDGRGGAGGKSRGRNSSGGANGDRFSPYGSAGAGSRGGRGGRGGRGAGRTQMMMVPHHVAQQMMLAQQGGGRGAGKGKSKKWTREGAEENAVGGEMDTSKIPCIFLARGSCKNGDACKYSHDVGDDDMGDIPLE